jgi:ketosteroid isomerase-like protein
MTTDRIELVREGLAAVNRGDPEGFMARVHPDFELRECFDVSTNPGPHRGPAGYLFWYREGGQQWSSYAVEVLDFLPVGELLLVEGEVRATGRASGFEARQRFGYVVEFRDDKIFRLDIYASLEDAKQAVS